MISLFIADDEPLARRRLRSIASKLDWIAVVGEAADGEAAYEQIVRLNPDVVMLDIRMPELSGIDLLARLRSLHKAPAVILTTAHDEFAIRAFELEAVDYVLKPIISARCVAALERARRTIGRVQSDASGTQGETDGAEAEKLDRILVRCGTKLTPVALSTIMNIEAQDDYALLHGVDGDHLTGIRMQEFERRLPSPPFMRVHRSHIVNLDHVARVAPGVEGRLSVMMRDGTTVPVSRDRAKMLRRLAR